MACREIEREGGGREDWAGLINNENPPNSSTTVGSVGLSPLADEAP